MIDKFLYKFFGSLDTFSFIETYSVKLTSWLWQTEQNFLEKAKEKIMKVSVNTSSFS